MIRIFIAEEDRELISLHTGKCIVIFNGHEEFKTNQRIVYNKRGHIDKNPVNGIKWEDSEGNVQKI